MNLLLDTNVFIDYLGRQKPFFECAERVVAAGYFGDAQLWVPVQSVKDAFFILRKYIDSARLQHSFVSVFDVVKPVGLSGDDAVRAARLAWDDYEDCLIALAADKVKADYLITRDSKGFERSSVPPMSPSDWLVMMERDHRLTYDSVTLDASASEGVKTAG